MATHKLSKRRSRVHAQTVSGEAAGAIVRERCRGGLSGGILKEYFFLTSYSWVGSGHPCELWKVKWGFSEKPSETHYLSFRTAIRTLLPFLLSPLIFLSHLINTWHPSVTTSPAGTNFLLTRWHSRQLSHASGEKKIKSQSSGSKNCAPSNL